MVLAGLVVLHGCEWETVSLVASVRLLRCGLLLLLLPISVSLHRGACWFNTGEFYSGVSGAREFLELVYGVAATAAFSSLSPAWLALRAAGCASPPISTSPSQVWLNVSALSPLLLCFPSNLLGSGEIHVDACCVSDRRSLRSVRFSPWRKLLSAFNCD